MRTERNGRVDGADMDAMRLEAALRRQRLAGNVEELSWRMRPGNLVKEARDRAWAEVDRMTDEALGIAEDLVHDMTDWVKDNRALALGGTATALLSAALVWYATRRKMVPLYAAYDMEDFPMSETDETLSAETLSTRAAGTWERAKDEAHKLGEQVGDKAGGAYYAARSRAAELSAEARERAIEAAAVAREKADEAAVAAREAAEKARIAAGEAGEWARRQPQENPAMVVVAALAAGALLGALLPSGGRRRD
jgi:ElaB/YqjD/DUF883 family membrane-anchored ribosome-binding protein